ncbi:peptide MFS transporter [Haloglycomyces albus]|uniref:peptide MFS transporter n=1 Tax=Haloglycomyces albus TaxID=526067 RepID=UPI00046CA7CF|nr:peptide MFS transporter [Haloglycomyces albus]
MRHSEPAGVADSGRNNAVPAANDRRFLGHPGGLAVLFGTEMWERFSFYGLQGILVLYLTATLANNGLGLDDTVAVPIASIYAGMVYLTALPGGWLADRVLGSRRAVLIGGIVIMLGHISMALPVTGPAFVFAGLALVIIGTGLLKPNISVMVGNLYPEDQDARRDSGFSLFYIGINIGALLGLIVTPFLAGDDRWHLGFSAAAVGMAIGLLWYMRGWSSISGPGNGPSRPLDPRERSLALRSILIGLAMVSVVMVVWVASGTFNLVTVPTVITVLGVLVVVGYFVYIFAQKHQMTPAEFTGMQVYVGLFLAAVVFFMLFQQIGSVLTVFANEEVNLDLFGWEIPAGATQNFNTLFILLFGGVAAGLWVKLGDRFNTVKKFTVGLVLIAAAFALLGSLQIIADGGATIALLWFGVVYLLMTWSELTISPVGLSVTSALAPQKLRGQMMGVWFLAPAVGTPVGGQLYALLVPHIGKSGFFFAMAAISGVAGLLMLVSVPKLSRLLVSAGHH